QPCGSVAPEPQIKRGRRKEGGDDPGVRETASFRRLDEDQMVGRVDSKAGGHSRAPGGPKLVGVNARLEPGTPAGLENRRRLAGREHAFLAKDVTPARETL